MINTRRKIKKVAPLPQNSYQTFSYFFLLLEINKANLLIRTHTNPAPNVNQKINKIVIENKSVRLFSILHQLAKNIYTTNSTNTA